MSHGVHLAAILDFVIRELRKLIISITFETSDIEIQTIPLFIYIRHEEPITNVNIAIKTFAMPQVKQKHVFKCRKSSKIRYSQFDHYLYIHRSPPPPPLPVAPITSMFLFIGLSWKGKDVNASNKGINFSPPP